MLRDLRLLVPGLLLCVVGIYRFAFPPSQGAESHLKDLPYQILGCPGEDLPTDAAILEDLDSDDLLIRLYRRPDGVPVWVVLVYFVNTRLGGHDPRLCYRSQGFTTEGLPDLAFSAQVGERRAESFLARRSNRAERVATFWYAPGGRLVADESQYRSRLLLEGLRRNRTYGVFVRISTLETGSQGEAEAWTSRFAAEVADMLPDLIRE